MFFQRTLGCAEAIAKSMWSKLGGIYGSKFMIGDIFIIRIQTCWFLMIWGPPNHPKRSTPSVVHCFFFRSPIFGNAPFCGSTVGSEQWEMIISWIPWLALKCSTELTKFVQFGAIRFLKYKHWLMEIAQKSWDLQIEWVVPRDANRHWSIGVKLVTPKLADNNCTVSCQMLCSSVLPQGCHLHWKIGNTPKCRGSEPTLIPSRSFSNGPVAGGYPRLLRRGYVEKHSFLEEDEVVAWDLPTENGYPDGSRYLAVELSFSLGFEATWGCQLDNWCLTTVIILPCLYWDYYQQGIPSNKPIRWQRCSSRKILTMRVRFHQKYEGSWVDENHVTCGRLVQMLGFQQCWCRSDITWYHFVFDVL